MAAAADPVAKVINKESRPAKVKHLAMVQSGDQRIAEDDGQVEGRSPREGQGRTTTSGRLGGYKAKGISQAVRTAAKANKLKKRRAVFDASPLCDGDTNSKVLQIEVSAGLVKEPDTTKTTKSTKTTRKVSSRALRVERSVTLPNGSRINLTGFSAGGKRYVLFEEGAKHAVTPYTAWTGGGREGGDALTGRDIVVIGARSKIAAAVALLKRFPSAVAATRSGFFAEGFALPDGKLIVPRASSKPIRAFAPAFEITAKAGSLEGWRLGVAAPLSDHSLASFFMMTMFAPPLLRMSGREGNFGLELAGPAGRGKSTLLQLMASAAGRAFGGDGATYVRTLNGTMNALEHTLALYNDMLLPLDEAALLPGAGSKAARAMQMRDMAFRFSVGQIRHRWGEEAGLVSRLIYVISTNRPLASLLGGPHSSEAEATVDRLITILLDDRPNGIFDSCPLAYPSTGAFAEALKSAAREHYGHAMPAYLRYLVQKRAEHPIGLPKWIRRHVASFVHQCEANTNDGSQSRVAEAFGLIYVAGLLAIRAKVLPSNYRCLDAALMAYRLHREHGRGTLSFDDRLRAILAHSDTIDLAKVDATKLTAEQIATYKAFLYNGRSGDRELLIPVNYRHYHFSDWNSIRHDRDVKQRHKASKDRNTKDRPIMAGWDKPFYCFEINDLEN